MMEVWDYYKIFYIFAAYNRVCNLSICDKLQALF